MKRIAKKLVSLLTAACICAMILTVGSFSANAGTYSPYDGDINGDGVISLLDASILGKYLSGQCDITDHEAADVNCDYVIDKLDQDIIIAFVVEAIETSNGRLPYCSNPLYTDLAIADMGIIRYYAHNFVDDTIADVNYSLSAEVFLLILREMFMLMIV